METYHKIQTVFLRDPENKFKTLLIGQFAKPEFEYLQDNYWLWTEKINGTNIRIQYDAETFTVKFNGKKDTSQIQTDLLCKIVDMFGVKRETFKNKFNDADVKVCLYGEGYGAKIQGGGKYRQDQSFVLFDVKINDWWLKREDVEDVAKTFDLDVAPIVGSGSLYEAVEFVKNGFNSQWGDFQAEGIVARPFVEMKARNGDRIITKIKYKDFPI